MLPREEEEDKGSPLDQLLGMKVTAAHLRSLTGSCRSVAVQNVTPELVKTDGRVQGC